MESGKKASIFSDRSAIGSADELDEYGVWVKSEPEDIALNDSVFLSQIGKAAEVTGMESGLNFDLPGTGADDVALTAGNLDALVYDSSFDVDFGDESKAGELSAEPSAGDGSVEVSGFDVDFGDEGETGELSGEVPADDGSVEVSGFDVDFGDEGKAGELSAEVPAGDASVEVSGFDVDFGDEGETGELSGEVPAGDGSVEVSGFDVDFGDETAAGEYDFEIKLEDIPEPPSTTNGETEAQDTAKAAPSQDGVLANELLLKIVGELSTIKAELNSLKDEISTIRDSALGSKPATFESETMLYGFGSETLSAAELEAVLNNSEIANVETAVTEDLPSDAGFDVLASEPWIEEAAAELDALASEAVTEEEAVETAADAESLPDQISVDLDLTETPDEGSPTDGTVAIDDLDDFDISGEARPVEDIVAPAPDVEEAAPATELDAPEGEAVEAVIEEEAVETAADAESLPDQISVDLDLAGTLDEGSPADGTAAIDDLGDFDISGEARPVEDIVVPAPDVEDAAPAAELDAPEDEAVEAVIEEEAVETAADAESLPDQISVDLDLTGTPDEGSPADGTSAIGDLGDFDISGEARPVEDIVAPAPDVEEAAPPDFVPEKPDYLSPDDLVDINEYRAAETAASVADVPAESHETTPRDAPVQSTPDPVATAQFKRELQIVLSYMDKLLEALPDEKIEEFARSEHFDTYKKVFKELGLV
jgi:hypothetical protein